MKKKIELDDVDVVFDPKPLTKSEQELLSNYIRERKAQSKLKAKKQRSKVVI